MCFYSKYKNESLTLHDEDCWSYYLNYILMDFCEIDIHGQKSIKIAYKS